MKVARLYTVDDIRIEQADVPAPGPGEALVRTRVCGVCTGDIMGWYMQRKAPLVFGHEPAGEIVALGPAMQAAGPAVGDRVFVHHHAPCGRCRRCRRGHHVHCETWRATNLRPGGMAEYFVVPAPNLIGDTLVLPDGVDFEAGSLIEPTACVVKSLRRGGLSCDDVVCVIGLGIMGQLHVALARAAGARVIASDMVPFRLGRARELGAERTVDIRSESLPAAIRETTGGELADLVICGPGSPAAMHAAIDAAAPGGRVVLFTTSEPDDRLPVSPYKLYFEEISLIPSYSCGPDDTREALRLICEGKVPVDGIVTHRFGLDHAAEAVKTAGLADQALKTLVVFDK